MKKKLLTLATLLLLAACSNNSGENAALTEKISYTGLTGDSVKLIKTGRLNFKVQDIDESARAISKLTQQTGGMVFNQQLTFAETDRRELKLAGDSLLVISVSWPQADITVRVPSERLQEFMFAVSDLGIHTRSSELNIDDQSLLYLENILKQKNRSETLASPPSQKNKGSDAQQAIAAKDDITTLQISNRNINAQTNYSCVKLSLFQNARVDREIVADHHIERYLLPAHQRLADAMNEGVRLFFSFVLLVANLWLYLLAGLVVLIIYRQYSQKRVTPGPHLK